MKAAIGFNQKMMGNYGRKWHKADQYVQGRKILTERRQNLTRVVAAQTLGAGSNQR